MVFDACGCTVGLESDLGNSELTMLLSQLLLPTWRQVQGPPDVRYLISGSGESYIVESGNEVLCDGIPLQGAVKALQRHCHLHVATYSPRFVFLHAGAVLAESGLIVLAGPTFSGKSTLVKSLVEQGCRYFSDEFALFDEEGKVHPFPRCLHERLGSFHALHHSPHSLGWECTLQAAVPRMILHTGYKPGAQWEPTEVSSGEALLLLTQQSVAIRIFPDRVLAHLQNVALKTRVYKGSRGEAWETAEQILELISTPL